MEQDNKKRPIIRQLDGREELFLRCDNCGRKLMPVGNYGSLDCPVCSIEAKHNNNEFLIINGIEKEKKG